VLRRGREVENVADGFQAPTRLPHTGRPSDFATARNRALRASRTKASRSRSSNGRARLQHRRWSGTVGPSVAAGEAGERPVGSTCIARRTTSHLISKAQCGPGDLASIAPGRADRSGIGSSASWAASCRQRRGGHASRGDGAPGMFCLRRRLDGALVLPPLPQKIYKIYGGRRPDEKHGP